MGLRPLVIGVECTATGRPVDTTWVEKIHTKHQHLPIDKTVLVSRAGFRAPALRKAEFLKIQALSLEESQHPEWIEQISSTRITFFVTEPPAVSKITGHFHPKHAPHESENVDPHTWVLYREDGRPLGTIVEAVTQMISRSPLEVDPSFYRPELAGFDFNGQPSDERFYTVGPTGQELDIIAFDVEGFIAVEVGVVELTPAQYASTNIAHGSGASESFAVAIRAVQAEDWIPGQPIKIEYSMRVPQRLAGHSLRLVPLADAGFQDASESPVPHG